MLLHFTWHNVLPAEVCKKLHPGCLCCAIDCKNSCAAVPVELLAGYNFHLSANFVTAWKTLSYTGVGMQKDFDQCFLFIEFLSELSYLLHFILLIYYSIGKMHCSEETFGRSVDVHISL